MSIKASDPVSEVNETFVPVNFVTDKFLLVILSILAEDPLIEFIEASPPKKFVADKFSIEAVVPVKLLVTSTFSNIEFTEGIPAGPVGPLYPVAPVEPVEPSPEITIKLLF